MQTPLETPYNPPAAPPKKKPNKLLLGCGLPIGAFILFCVIAAILDPTPAPQTSQSAASSAQTASKLPLYAGKWQGSDGTSIWIRGDGKGDFDGGSTKVSGGGVTIDDAAKTLAITSFFGIGHTWKISSAPQNGQMTLDGIVYRRNNGFSAPTSNSSDDSSAAAPVSMPSATAQDKMARTTLAEFDRGLTERDFSRFYRFSAKAWQAQTSPTQLKAGFSDFLSGNKRITRTIRELRPVYSVPKLIETKYGSILTIKGVYMTAPYRTHFVIGYLNESGVWRPCAFQVKIGDPIS